MLIVDCPLCERPGAVRRRRGRARLRRLRRPPGDRRRRSGRPADRRLTDRPHARSAPRAVVAGGILPRRLSRAVRGAGAPTEDDRAWTSASTPPSWSGRSSSSSIGYLSIPAFANASAPGAPNLLVVPWSFGLGLLAAIFAFGHISGGHFNPAVTIAMVLDKRTTPIDAVGYILSQIIGAIFAAAHRVRRGQPAGGQERASRPPARASRDVGALIIEIVATAGFLAVILAASKRDAGACGPGHPPDARRDPLRDRDAERRLGQPGALARVRDRRRRHLEDLDLHRRADRRRHPRLAGLAPDRRRRRDLPGGAARRGGGREPERIQIPGVDAPAAGRGVASGPRVSRRARASACSIAGGGRPGPATTASRIGRSRGPASASQQAAWWPSATSISGGSSTRHRSNASGQRGWNRQPGGTWTASGVSPTRIVRFALPADLGRVR